MCRAVRAEAVLQPRGWAGKHQVPGAETALAHGVTGICGQHQAVMILGKHERGGE